MGIASDHALYLQEHPSARTDSIPGDQIKRCRDAAMVANFRASRESWLRAIAPAVPGKQDEKNKKKVPDRTTGRKRTHLGGDRHLVAWADTPFNKGVLFRCDNRVGVGLGRMWFQRERVRRENKVEARSRSKERP